MPYQNKKNMKTTKRYVSIISVYIHVEGEDGDHDQKAVKKAKKLAKKLDKIFPSGAAKCEDIYEQPFGRITNRKIHFS